MTTKTTSNRCPSYKLEISRDNQIVNNGQRKTNLMCFLAWTWVTLDPGITFSLLLIFWMSPATVAFLFPTHPFKTTFLKTKMESHMSFLALAFLDTFVGFQVKYIIFFSFWFFWNWVSLVWPWSCWNLLWLRYVLAFRKSFVQCNVMQGVFHVTC